MSGLDEAVINAGFRERRPKMLPWDETLLDEDSALNPTSQEQVNTRVDIEDARTNGIDISQTDVADENCIVPQKTIDEIHTKMALGDIPIVNERLLMPNAYKTDDKWKGTQLGNVIVDGGLENEIPGRNPKYDILGRYPARYCPSISNELFNTVSMIPTLNGTKVKGLYDHIKGNDKLGFIFDSPKGAKGELEKCYLPSFCTDSGISCKSFVDASKADIFGQRQTNQTVTANQFEQKAELATRNVSTKPKDELTEPKKDLICKTNVSRDMIEETKRFVSTRRKYGRDKPLDTPEKPLIEKKYAHKDSQNLDQQMTDASCKIDNLRAPSKNDRKERNVLLQARQTDHHSTGTDDIVDKLLALTNELKSQGAVVLKSNKGLKKSEYIDVKEKNNALDGQNAIPEILHKSDDKVAFTSNTRIKTVKHEDASIKSDAFDYQEIIREILHSPDDEEAVTPNTKIKKVEHEDAITKNDAFDTQKIIYEILHSSDDEAAFTSNTKIKKVEHEDASIKSDVFDYQEMIREILHSSDDEVVSKSNNRIKKEECIDANAKIKEVIREILHSSEDEVCYKREDRKDKNAGGYLDGEKGKRKKSGAKNTNIKRDSTKNGIIEPCFAVLDTTNSTKEKAADGKENIDEIVKLTRTGKDNKQPKQKCKRRKKPKHNTIRTNERHQIGENDVTREKIEEVNRKGDDVFVRKVKQRKQKKMHSKILVVEPEEIQRKNRRRAFQESKCIQNSFSQILAKGNVPYQEKNIKSEDDIFDISPVKDTGGLLDSDTDEMKSVNKYDINDTIGNKDTQMIYCERREKSKGYSESVRNKREIRKRNRKKPKVWPTISDGLSQTVIEKNYTKKKIGQVNIKTDIALDYVKVGDNDNETSKQKQTVQKRARKIQKKDIPPQVNPSTRLYSTEEGNTIQNKKRKTRNNGVKKEESVEERNSRKLMTTAEENHKMHSAKLTQDLSADSTLKDNSKVQNDFQLVQSRDSVISVPESDRCIVIGSKVNSDDNNKTDDVDNGESDSIQTNNINDTEGTDNDEMEEHRPKQHGRLERFFRWCLCCLKPKPKE